MWLSQWDIVTPLVIKWPPLFASIRIFSDASCFSGLEDYDSVLSTYKLARSNLAEILSSCELMDRESVAIAKKNLNISCPLPEAPFYMLFETSGSDENHDEEKLSRFLSSCMEKKMITDGLTTSEPSKMKVYGEVMRGLRRKLCFFVKLGWTQLLYCFRHVRIVKIILCW